MRIISNHRPSRSRCHRPQVLTEQRHHLRRMAQQPHISVRVIPFAAGAHPAHKGGFTVLEPRDPEDLDVVYVEALNGASYRETAADLERFRALLDRFTPGECAAFLDGAKRAEFDHLTD